MHLGVSHHPSEDYFSFFRFLLDSSNNAAGFTQPQDGFSNALSVSLEVLVWLDIRTPSNYDEDDDEHSRAEGREVVYASPAVAEHFSGRI